MSKLCPVCGSEIPTNSKFCSNCGKQVVGNEVLSESDMLRKRIKELEESNELLKEKSKNDFEDYSNTLSQKDATIEDLKSQLSLLTRSKDLANNKNADTIIEQKRQIDALSKQVDELKKKPGKSSRGKANRTGHAKNTIVMVACLAIAAIIFGCIYYNNVYLPAKIDRERPRYYSFVNSLKIRSSTDTVGDDNTLMEIPYGSELIYEHGDEWYKIKYIDPDTGEPIEGYVYSKYVFTKGELDYLNSLFGDENAKECIKLAKCRTALLNYYYYHVLGNSDYDNSDYDYVEVEPETTWNESRNEWGGRTDWAVFCRNDKQTKNDVFYGSVDGIKGKVFAAILTNKTTKERRCLVFTFNENDEATLIHEEPTEGDGYIDEITYTYKDSNSPYETSNRKSIIVTYSSTNMPNIDSPMLNYKLPSRTNQSVERQEAIKNIQQQEKRKQNGDSAAAAKNMNNKSCDFNMALIQLLQGDYINAKKTIDCIADKDAKTYYLAAVLGARTQNDNAVYSNLRECVKMDATFMAKAKKDAEFKKYKNRPDFKDIVR